MIIFYNSSNVSHISPKLDILELINTTVEVLRETCSKNCRSQSVFRSDTLHSMVIKTKIFLGNIELINGTYN